jgi:aquaporin Z
MNKYVTELIGTFFLVFTIGLSVVGNVPLAPLAIGLGLMALVYMGGHVSGAHYNPAVTVSVLLRGKMAGSEVVPYWIAQLGGAVAAAAAVYAITGKTFAPAPAESAGIWAPLAVEALFTFALALVILNVATAAATSGNSYYGLAIGMTVCAAAFAGGPISGGAFNPAVGVGPWIVRTLAGGGSIIPIWIYLVGPFAGAVLAAWVYRLQHPTE